MNRKYYLYRHVRIDTNEVFYIGIGTKSNKNHTAPEHEYSRAFSTKNRSKFWQGIVTRTNYEIEVLFESNDHETIEAKEIEFIALYGRRNLSKGTLCNLTNGGGGCKGWKAPEGFGKAISERQVGSKNPMFGRKGEQSPLFGKPRTLEHSRNIGLGMKRENHRCAKIVLCKETGIFYLSTPDAAEAYNLNENTLRAYLNGYRINRTSLIAV